MAGSESLLDRDGDEERQTSTELSVESEPDSGPDFGSDDAATATAAVRARRNQADAEDGWRWRVVAGLGVLSLAAAVAVVALPGTLLPPVRFTAETVASMRSFALLLGAFVGIFGLYVAYHRETDETVADDAPSVDLPSEDPELSHGPTNDAVGAQLDQYLERIGGMADGSSGNQYTVYKVRQNLEALAVRVVADAAGCSRARAQHHVAQGTWTDDVRAAAFVGGRDAPEPTLAMRIRDWANGSTFDRQVRATVDELARLNAGESS